jgi:hypothetical protein
MSSVRLGGRLGIVAAATWGLAATVAHAGALLATPTDPSVTNLPPVVLDANGNLNLPFYTQQPTTNGGLTPLPVVPTGPVHSNILGFSRGDDSSYTVGGPRGPVHFPGMLAALAGSSTGLAGISGRVDFLEVGGTGTNTSLGYDMFTRLHQTVGNSTYCNVKQEIPATSSNTSLLASKGCSAVNGGGSLTNVTPAPSYLVVLVDGFDWTGGSSSTNEMLNLLSMMNDNIPTLLIFDDNGVPSSRINAGAGVPATMDMAFTVQQFDPSAGNGLFGQTSALSFGSTTNNVPEPATGWLLAAAALAASLAKRRPGKAGREAQPESAA